MTNIQSFYTYHINNFLFIIYIMKDLVIVFVILAVLLTFLSTLGGSLKADSLAQPLLNVAPALFSKDHFSEEEENEENEEKDTIEELDVKQGGAEDIVSSCGMIHTGDNVSPHEDGAAYADFMP